MVWHCDTTATLSDHQLLERRLMLSSACVSIVGCMCTLVSFLRVPSLREYPLIIIGYISVSDLFYTTGLAMQIIPELVQQDLETLNCDFAFFATLWANFGVLASHFWISVYALHCAKQMRSLAKKKGRSDPTSRRVLKIVLHAVTWPLSAGLSLYHTAELGNPLLFMQMGSNYVSWLALVLPIVIAWSFSLLCFVFVCLLLSRMGRDGEELSSTVQETLSNIRNRLNVFILVYLLCWLFFFLTLMAFFFKITTPPWFDLVWVFTIPLQGGFNAVILGKNEALRSPVIRSLRTFSARVRSIFAREGDGAVSMAPYNEPLIL